MNLRFVHAFPPSSAGQAEKPTVEDKTWCLRSPTRETQRSVGFATITENKNEKDSAAKYSLLSAIAVSFFATCVKLLT